MVSQTLHSIQIIDSEFTDGRNIVMNFDKENKGLRLLNNWSLLSKFVPIVLKK